jgi:hypothetical protein
MRYWWVNQKQTYRHEVPGGYLWSPKRKKNNSRNPFYDFMREIAPGDAIFSFADAYIKAIGSAISHAYEAPKPLEFGNTGAYWDQIGWRVDVHFTELRGPIRPSEHMRVLGAYLPKRYSPLNDDGHGSQNMYLTQLNEGLAGALADLIGYEARVLLRPSRIASENPSSSAATGLAQWEEHELQIVHSDQRITPTMREAIVLARRGQGLFKSRVMERERACRITGVDRIEHLRASHCKPWRDASNDERLDGENGLLLTPNADHLFDRGFIGFDDDGEVLISPVADALSLARMGIDAQRPPNVGQFTTRQQSFLAFHRESVFLRSKFLEDT